MARNQEPERPGRFQWMDLDHPLTATDIGSGLREFTFSFCCYQGRVRVDFSRDVRDVPPVALLGVPQADILPFKWTSDFCDMTAVELSQYIPWWDPRISEEMVRRNLFALTAAEKKMREQTSVNRRNIQKKTHKWNRVVQLQYRQPRLAYWRAHREELRQQKAALAAIGREVKDKEKQAPYPSEDELTDVESDGGTRSRVRRVVDRRERQVGRPRAPSKKALEKPSPNVRRPRQPPVRPAPAVTAAVIPTGATEDAPVLSRGDSARPSGTAPNETQGGVGLGVWRT